MYLLLILCKLLQAHLSAYAVIRSIHCFMGRRTCRQHSTARSSIAQHSRHNESISKPAHLSEDCTVPVSWFILLLLLQLGHILTLASVVLHTRILKIDWICSHTTVRCLSVTWGLESTHYRVVSTFTLAVNDLLVGQNSAQRRTPVDWHLGLIGQTLLEQLQENPLGPSAVSWFENERIQRLALSRWQAGSRCEYQVCVCMCFVTIKQEDPLGPPAVSCACQHGGGQQNRGGLRGQGCAGQTPA
jgi:hypothetical protein